jgi:hypothetical protein
MHNFFSYNVRSARQASTSAAASQHCMSLNAEISHKRRARSAKSMQGNTNLTPHTLLIANCKIAPFDLGEMNARPHSISLRNRKT